MRHVILLISFLLLTSCEVFQGAPVFDKPNPKALMGSYAVTKVSLSVANRRDLKRITLHLSADGTFQISNRNPHLASPLIPGDQGTWDLQKTSGADIASGQSWAVCCTSKDGSSKYGLCLMDSRHRDAPYRLFFLHDSDSRLFDDFLIMTKVK